MRTCLAAAVTGVLLALGPGSAVRGQEPPQRSVFVVVVMEHAMQGPYRSAYRGADYGTGFFVAPDGTAITSSHVVYPVRANPITYHLLAIVGREFYGAKLICASELPYDPATRSTGVPLSRDVAEIRLTSPDFPFEQLEYGNTLYASAHRGPLPAFPPLALAADPAVGDDVRVLGFGYLTQAPIPYEWSALGTVSRTRELPDGTPVFEVTMTREAEPGHSGSPVLNMSDQVVGVWNWVSERDPMKGTAIGSAALDPVCH
jgi:S1-C subfamily serine protease